MFDNVLLSGELFAKCPVDDYPGLAVEAVLDSSRYFVLKIVDDSGTCVFCLFVCLVGCFFFFWCMVQMSRSFFEFILSELLNNFLFLFLSGTGRHAFIGMGFQDRGDSFDFNVAMQDHFKYVDQALTIN